MNLKNQNKFILISIYLLIVSTDYVASRSIIRNLMNQSLKQKCVMEKIDLNENNEEFFCKCNDGTDFKYGLNCDNLHDNPCLDGTPQHQKPHDSIPEQYFVHCANKLPHLFKCPANLIWNDDIKTCSRGRSTGRSINRKKIQQTLPKTTEQFGSYVTTTSTPVFDGTTAKMILKNQESSIDQYGQQMNVQVGEQTPSYENQQINNNQELESQSYQSFSTTTMPTPIESTTVVAPLVATFDLNDLNIINYYKDNLELKQAPPAPVQEVYNQESSVEPMRSESENSQQESVLNVNNYEEYQSSTIPTLTVEIETSSVSQLIELSNNYMQVPSASSESYYTQNIETKTSTEAPPVETSTQFLIEQSNEISEDNYKIIQYYINNPRPLEQVNQYSSSNDMLQVNSPVEQEVIQSSDSYNQNLEQVEVDTNVQSIEQTTDQTYSGNNDTLVEENQMVISVKQDELPLNKYSESVKEIKDLIIQQERPIVKQFDEYEQKVKTQVDLNNKEADQTVSYSSDEYKKKKVENSVQQEISASDQLVSFNSNEYGQKGNLVLDLSDKQQLPSLNYQNQAPITTATTANKFNDHKTASILVNIQQPTINVVKDLHVLQIETTPAYNSNLQTTTMVPQTSTTQLELATNSPIVESSNDYEIFGYYRKNEQLPKVTTPRNLGTIIKSNFKLDYESHRNLQRKIESQRPLVSATKASEIVLQNPAKTLGTFNPSFGISSQQKDVLNRISKVLVNNTPNTNSNIQIDNNSNSAEFIIKNPFLQVSGVPNNTSLATADLNTAKGLKILFTILF